MELSALKPVEQVGLVNKFMNILRSFLVFFCNLVYKNFNCFAWIVFLNREYVPKFHKSQVKSNPMKINHYDLENIFWCGIILDRWILIVRVVLLKQTKKSVSQWINFCLSLFFGFSQNRFLWTVLLAIRA